jgi:hypothetical protein
MIIYFRACEKQDTIHYVTRFNNFNKTIILKKCWLSIQKSIKNTDTLKNWVHIWKNINV